MKVCVTMKSPDSLSDACREAAHESVLNDNLSTLEEEAEIEDRAKALQEIITKQFMPHGEYVTIEFDTDAGTAEVIRN